MYIDEKVYGPDHPAVAADANNIGMILQDKGDLDGALEYTQRALRIAEKACWAGPTSRSPLRKEHRPHSQGQRGADEAH